MKLSMPDCNSERAGDTNIQVVDNGARVTKYRQIQALPDGGSVTKMRVSIRFPETKSAEPQVLKRITTTLIRKDHNGTVGNTTTIEETITTPGSFTEPFSSTHSYILPDGSSCFVTKSKSKLNNGSISNVLTKVHLNPVGFQEGSCGEYHHYGFEQPLTEINYNEAMIQPQQTTEATDPGAHLDITASHEESHVPFGYDESCKFDTSSHSMLSTPARYGYNDSINICKHPACLEILSDVSAVVPPQLVTEDGAKIPVTAIPFKLPSLHLDNSDNERHDCGEDNNMNIDTIKNEIKNKVSNELSTKIYHAQHFTQQFRKADKPACKNTSLDAQLRQYPHIQEASLSHEIDCTFRTSPTMLRIIDSSRNSDPPVTTIKLAEATPVDASGSEEPIVEAAEYFIHSNTAIHEKKRCIAITTMVLIVIGVLVVMAVVYSTKAMQRANGQNETKFSSPGSYSSPTPSPTTRRASEIQERIERSVLKKKATFSSMSKTDPRVLALDWIVNKDEMKIDHDNPNLQQRYTLALLAFQFGTQAWSNNNTNETHGESFDWLVSIEECNWFGISCVEKKVTEIDLCLANNNLIGEIPPEIANLVSLELLFLDYNCLYGTIPSEVGTLLNLQYLDLQGNGLSGYIADEFYNLSQLIYLDLSRQINNDHNCTSIDGKEVRPFFQMADPNNDENIGFKGKILEEIGQLQQLKTLKLMENSFSGSISEEIKNLKNLEVLQAGENLFVDTIPLEISTLPNLRILHLERNAFSGPLPEEIGNANALEEIYFWVEKNGKMNGTIPDSFYSLNQLKRFSISQHAFGGQINSKIGHLKELIEFKINGNDFTGPLPSELGLCEKLEIIFIQNTKINGTVPDEVCQLREKNLIPKYFWDDAFKADCSPENGAAFITCHEDCCTTCCEHTTGFC